MAEALILKSGGGITSDEVTASRAQVLTGYTAVTNDSGDEVAQGTMPNRQAVSVTLKAGDVYAVPAGYHNGNGRVTANNLTVQTPGDATAANITSGRKAWVNGVQIVGNGADNTSFYNNGVAYADSRINPSSASYTSGYTNGVTAADARVNHNSASYKNGYSSGVVAGKASYEERTVSIGGDEIVSGGSVVKSGNDVTYTATFSGPIQKAAIVSFNGWFYSWLDNFNHYTNPIISISISGNTASVKIRLNDGHDACVTKTRDKFVENSITILGILA